MKKNIPILYILLIIEILILINSKTIISNVLYSSKIFIYNIFPSMFPTMVFGNLLVNQKIDRIIPGSIKKIFSKIFNFDDYKTGLFITSILTGSPSNAIYINEYLNNNIISIKEAEMMLCSSHFINPLFIIGFAGGLIFNDIKIGFLLFILLLTENLIKLFINRKNFNNKYIYKNNNIDNNFIDSFIKSIKTSANACLIIFGFVIIFNIFLTLFSTTFKLNDNIILIINGIFEMTSGISKIKYINLPKIIKFILVYFFINFGGLCIHMQTLAMFKNKKIRYIKYLIYRLF